MTDTTYVNIKNYGGGNGIDDDAVIAEQLFADNPGCTIFFPPGQYRLDTTLDVPANANGNRLRGSSRQAAVLTVYGDNITGVQFESGPTGFGLEHLSIYGPGTTRTAGYGFDFPGQAGLPLVRDVRVRNHWRGAGFTSTDYGIIDTIIADNNFSHGLHFRNDAISGALQWQICNSLSQLNGGSGCVFESVNNGPPQCTMGRIEMATYANASFGIHIKGSANVPIHDARIVNCFLGGDGNNEIHLDSFGSRHLINGGFMELCGRTSNGRNHENAMTGIGSSLYISANNGLVNVDAFHSEANSHDGIFTGADLCVITGPTCMSNGIAGTASRRNGIFHYAGEVVISGGALLNQQYGIMSHDGRYLTAAGVRLKGNSAPTQINSYVSSALLTGCRT